MRHESQAVSNIKCNTLVNGSMGFVQQSLSPPYCAHENLCYNLRQQQPSRLLRKLSSNEGFLFIIMMFTKPALTIEKQIDKLTSSGMVVADKQKAKHYLEHFGYYRLSGYWYIFKQDTNSEKFKENTDFNNIIDRYTFDQELRQLLIVYLEKIESSLRTRLAYHWAIEHGPHNYLENNEYKTNLECTDFVYKVKKLVGDSRENFIKVYKDNYKESCLTPPIWMVCQILSFGALSKLLSYLKKSSKVSKKLFAEYDLPSHELMVSIIRSFSYLRNTCAHHSRLIARNLTVKAMLITSKKLECIDLLESFEKDMDLYNSCCYIKFFLRKVSKENNLSTELLDLIKKYRISSDDMSFPEKWHDRPIWMSTQS
jgi:abortive infection bacteriophage resistance protein